jgi:ATP-dependent exoDNAse (exonuclease V) beta subunit
MTINFAQKFDYTPINRETINGKRHYCLPDGSKVASVTTILDKTKPKEKMEALQKWRDFVGHDKAQVITTEAAGVGTVMHKMLEEHCLGKAKPPGTNNVQKIAHPMAQQIIQNGLVHMTECWGTELPLYYPGLYAGTTDLAGVWKGNESILDFKQTNKPKKEEWIDDYKLQLAAYATAHNIVHGTNIKQGVILMCSRACEYQEFVIRGADFAYWQDQWWNRVEQYYRSH